jgi:hypothetical protein
MKKIIKWLETRLAQSTGPVAAEEEWPNNLMPNIYDEEETVPNLAILEEPHPRPDPD